MTTITIKNDNKISRKVFEDLDDLQRYISSIVSDDGLLLSSEMDKELDKRYEDLKSGDIQGISLEDVKEKYTKRII